MIDKYSEPMVGYPENYKRITLFGKKKDVCTFSLYLNFRFGDFFVQIRPIVE